MHKILTNRRDNEDKGFTLIELMVVVLIIAILLAIAIPTFLGAQTKAKDRGAQSAARNALTAAKTIYADEGNYIEATAAKLLQVEPGMAFVDAASSSAGPKSVSVKADTDGKTWYAAVLSESGECFHIRDSILAAMPGTAYANAPGTKDTCIAGTPAAAAYLDEWGAQAPAPAPTGT